MGAVDQLHRFALKMVQAFLYPRGQAGDVLGFDRPGMNGTDRDVQAQAVFYLVEILQ